MSLIPSFLSNRLVIIFVSLVVALLSVNQYYFPFLGLSLVGAGLVVYTVISNSKLVIADYIFGLIAILSALVFGIYTSPLVLFFALFIYFYASGWLVYKSPDYGNSNEGNSNTFIKFVHLLFPFVFAFFEVWMTADTTPKLSTRPKSNFNLILNRFPKLLLNILITLGILSVIIPLLSYSNPYFGQYIGELFDNIIRQIVDIFSWSTVLRGLVFVYFLFFIPRLFCFCQKDFSKLVEVGGQVNNKVNDQTNSGEFGLGLPKVAVIVTLFGFFFAQLQTYLNPNLLQNSSGKLTNEIFFHLSVVCLVVFILLYVNLKKDVLAKISSGVLLFQSLFLVWIAFNSDWSYVIN